MVITNIILFISILNFILTLFIFLNARELKQHISFLIFSFVATVWLFDNFLLRIYPYTVFGPLSYGLGILVATSALLWVYNLVEEENPKFLFYFIIPFSVLVFFTSSFTNYVVSSFSISGLFGYTGEKGILFTEYSFYIGFLIFFCLYKLLKKSIKEKDVLKKKQILSVLIGATLFGLLAFTIDFFIPMFFNSFRVSGLVSFTYFPFLVVTFYAIAKHNLFGINIITTQFLVAIFLSLLLLNFLISNSLNQYIWNGTLLLTSFLISYLIIKFTLNEIGLYKKSLEEAQKNLELEQSTKKEFIEKSGKIIRIMEKIVSDKSNNNKGRV